MSFTSKIKVILVVLFLGLNLFLLFFLAISMPTITLLINVIIVLIGLLFWFVFDKIFVSVFSPIFIDFVTKLEGIGKNSTLIEVKDDLVPHSDLKKFFEFSFAPVMISLAFIAFFGENLIAVSEEMRYTFFGIVMLFIPGMSVIIVLPIYLFTYSPFRVFRKDRRELTRFGSNLLSALNAVAGFGVIYRTIILSMKFGELGIIALSLVGITTIPTLLIIFIYTKFRWRNSINSIKNKIIEKVVNVVNYEDVINEEILI